MVRAAFYDKNGVKKGVWSIEEDNILRAYVERNGHDNWRQLPKLAGLSRCGKSCRLRWKNYLQPNVKRGMFTSKEEDMIMKLHEKLGNKWSMIAEQLTGRSDNEIKNHWHTHLKKRVKHHHMMKPQADDQMREFPNIDQPPQNFETIESSDSENSDVPVDKYPSYSISGTSALNKFPANIFLEESSFYYQSPLPAYAPTSSFSEEQQLVDYAAPLEIVGEWISNEFWTQPYLTDKDIIHTIKFADNTAQSINAQGA